MQIKAFTTQKIPVLSLGIILFIYCFLAFLPAPSPITTGLDPSWSYAISKAAQENLVFGKDIIFTYGPLGYLIGGSVVEDNFWSIIIFRWFVYLGLLVISILRIVTLKSFSQQLFLVISILFALFQGISVDYQILLIFLIFLTFENLFKKYLGYLSLCLGIISGLAGLTKLTLGAYLLVSLELFLLGHLYHYLKLKDFAGIRKITGAIVNSLLCAISAAYIFFLPNYYIVYLQEIFRLLTFSAFLGFITYIVAQKVPLILEIKKSKKYLITQLCQSTFLPWLIFYLTYGLLLFYSILSQTSFSLIDYIQNSLAISSGYSSAMSFVGDKGKLGFAISNFLIIIALLSFVPKNGNLGLYLALLFNLFLAFKHGTIRQDVSHIIPLYMVFIFITSLLYFTLKQQKKYKKIIRIFFVYLLITSLTTGTTMYLSFLSLVAQSGKLIDPSVKHNTEMIGNLNNLKSQIEEKSLANIASLKLPTQVRNLLKDKTIDIIPWEISLVPANDLNWNPRPIFQSYSAYTKKLDHLNFKSLSEIPRDYILYHFNSIDKRHNFFNEPKTFAYVFCNYQPSPEISQSMLLETSDPMTQVLKLIVLSHSNYSRCLPTPTGETITIPWNTFQTIPVKNDRLLRGEIKINYTLFGKIYKTLFRAAPVMMRVNYVDGKTEDYRIIPENSDNGVIVSHLPRDYEEVKSFFRGDLKSAAPVQSFSFYAINPWLYKPTIEITFSSTKLLF